MKDKIHAMFKKFNSVVLFVHDVDAAVKWYADILNCEINYENSDYAYITLTTGNIGFHREDQKNRNSTIGQTVYWSVDDLYKAKDTLIARGAILYRKPMETDLKEIACMLTDPFGNSIGLISESN